MRPWLFSAGFLIILLAQCACQAASPTDTSLTRRHKLPYLQLIGHRDGIAVWIVDGAYVRTHIDEEFTNFGQHYNFTFIPEHEFWLDKERVPDERKFFIDHLLIEYGMMKKGISYDSALTVADSLEQSKRIRSGDLKKVLGSSGLPDPRKVHQRLWKKLESGVSVWIIDGRLVRSVFDVDFTEGGHDHVYEFIPENEVWIDNDLQEVERPYVLFHELHERNLMAQGWDYDRAHDESSKLERFYRLHPGELHEGLAKEGWE